MMLKPTYVRHIHPTILEAIKERFEERYSIQELLIMYRPELHDNTRIALRQVKALTKDLKRLERI